MRLLDSYLPKDTAGSSGYIEGGALYALGQLPIPCPYLTSSRSHFEAQFYALVDLITF